MLRLWKSLHAKFLYLSFWESVTTFLLITWAQTLKILPNSFFLFLATLSHSIPDGSASLAAPKSLLF